jgi:hypothetical protein
MKTRRPKKGSYASGTSRKVQQAFSDVEKQIIAEAAALRARLSKLAPEREKEKQRMHP